MESIKHRLRGLISSMLSEALNRNLSVSYWKNRKGTTYSVGKLGNDVFYVAEPSVSIEDEDIHFIEDLKKLDSRVKAVIRDVNRGSKIFWFRYKNSKMQVLKSKIDGRAILVAINGTKVDNPKRKDGKFETFADVVSYCVKFL